MTCIDLLCSLIHLLSYSNLPCLDILCWSFLIFSCPCNKSFEPVNIVHHYCTYHLGLHLLEHLVLVLFFLQFKIIYFHLLTRWQSVEYNLGVKLTQLETVRTRLLGWIQKHDSTARAISEVEKLVDSLRTSEEGSGDYYLTNLSTIDRVKVVCYVNFQYNCRSKHFSNCQHNNGVCYCFRCLYPVVKQFYFGSIYLSWIPVSSNKCTCVFFQKEISDLRRELTSLERQSDLLLEDADESALVVQKLRQSDLERRLENLNKIVSELTINMKVNQQKQAEFEGVLEEVETFLDDAKSSVVQRRRWLRHVGQGFQLSTSERSVRTVCSKAA